MRYFEKQSLSPELLGRAGTKAKQLALSLGHVKPYNVNNDIKALERLKQYQLFSYGANAKKRFKNFGEITYR